MATFLTTSKMDPALAARIESSVRGRKLESKTRDAGVRDAHPLARASRRGSNTRRLVALARLVLVVTAVFGVYTVVVGRREAKRALEQARANLLDSVRAQGASLRPEDHAAVTRTESWLSRLAGEYEGDLVADELRGAGAFAATLAQPTVYVRGAADAVTSASRIAVASSTSAKDAVVLCLLEPPATRAEKALLDKVRVAYSGGWNLENRTPNVRRLNDAVVGLPFLSPAWSDKVRGAADATELGRLRSELERAPIDRAKHAAQAHLLLATIDEPGDGNGPTELDGERIHPVRVVLVDLRAGKVLLRARHVVDPSWITPARRATYAIGLDGCALALDVHEDVRKAQK